MGLSLLLISIFFILISLVIKRNVKNLKKKHEIQNGVITYTDLNKTSKTLYSKRYRISGKPDYIIKRDGAQIPVEVKTGKHYHLKESHKFQLAVYCHLLEENYNKLVPYGIIVYSDTHKIYKIPFNPKIRFELENIIKKMRTLLRTNEIEKDHIDARKCIRCSMNNNCNCKDI